MSMQTDCIYGYGFVIYASDEQLRQFILIHKDTISHIANGRELLNYVADHQDDSFNPKEDFYDWENGITGDSGIYGMIADVMYEETGVCFEYHCGQENDDDAILLPQMYPWQMNKKEESLTEDSLREICKKYIADLGGQLTTDYIRMEYFG